MCDMLAVVCVHQAWIFAELDFGADGKLAKKIQEKFKAVHPTSSSVIDSIDDEGEK